MKPNITMIGMPSSGKSTVGVLLAKRLGFSFIDVDIVIQEEEGKLLKEIIKEQGLDGFMEVENRVNAGLRANRAVIAPGGSVIYGKEAMDKLKNSRVAIFGLGGGGGYVGEALVRSRIGSFDLIDDDKICLTNLNRQIIATYDTVGKYKTDVMKDEYC